jgi:hypothetical protein
MTRTTLEERVTALESEMNRWNERFASLYIPSPEVGSIAQDEDDGSNLQAIHDASEVNDVAILSDAEIREQIERIRQEYPATSRPQPTAADFLDRFAGVFANDPAFPEVVRYSEEKREHERHEANREP